MLSYLNGMLKVGPESASSHPGAQSRLSTIAKFASFSPSLALQAPRATGKAVLLLSRTPTCCSVVCTSPPSLKVSLRLSISVRKATRLILSTVFGQTADQPLDFDIVKSKFAELTKVSFLLQVHASSWLS